MAYIGSGLTRFNTADDLTVTDDAAIGGDLTVTGSADINGGTIDGVTIGGASAGAITATTITGSGDMNIDSGTLFVDASDDRVGINKTDATSSTFTVKNVNDTTHNTAEFFNDNNNRNVRFAQDTSGNATLLLEKDDGTDTILLNTNGDSYINGGNVGIGTSSPSNLLHVQGDFSSATQGVVANFNSGNSGVGSGPIVKWSNDFVEAAITMNNTGSNATALTFETMSGGSLSEAVRIDSSGNLLVGKTGTSSTTDGVAIFGGSANGTVTITRNGNRPLLINRRTSDGALIELRKDNTTVGSIGTQNGSDFYITGTSADDTGLRFQTNEIVPVNDAGNNRDNVIDLGNQNVRFDDIYATNGTIQTSDRNEKQDIETLSEAEQRVAVAAKSLLRKFRWKDKVDEKGDDARIHFGIIAQDLQAAFEAEGLDAGRYAMFIYSEWWETYTDVPAVEAQDAVYETVTDEEGNETQVLVSEAVEAKEAYTRTDTYDTEEEAPEGAVKKSRMGVRYSELLAFIIAAI